MPTEKLYWRDPFATAFEATARRGDFQGRASIVLDRTLFYPEGGGQLADMGTLALGDRAIAIADVQIDDDGVIHHLADDGVDLKAVPELGAGAAARGAIDPVRRRDHMAQHTAQHMLSRALVEVAKADTVSARLGATSCTLDVDAAAVSDADLARAEDLTNAVVRNDVVVRDLFPTADELAAMKLRRAPKVSQGVRVVDVDGFDLTPCGGTHCTRTGQIGAVSIVATERYKGKMRVSFHAAGRALAYARAHQNALAGLARDLTCGPLEVASAIAKLRGELKARLDALSSARGELVALLTDRALRDHPPSEGGTTPIVIARERDDVPSLRALAGRLASRDDVVALCASRDEASGDLLVVVQRGARARFDAGAWFKRASAASGGRGGGKPDRAEGRFPARITVEELAKSCPLLEPGASNA